MDKDTQTAYEWAKKQDFPSVAARYAKMLASEIDRLTAENAELNAWKSGKRGVEEYYAVVQDLREERITSQSLRNAANGYKIELDAERKKANDARNELCLKCGRYHEAHNGACDGCRWGDVTEGGPQ